MKRYVVVWEKTDDSQGETNELGLEECLAMFPSIVRDLEKQGGFNWVQIEPR